MAAVKKATPVVKTPVSKDPGRAAYQKAMSQLREENRDRFDVLLDEAYAEQGLKSPRLLKVERHEVAQAAVADRAQRKQERAAARAAKLREELARVEAVLAPVSPGGDPEGDDPAAHIYEDGAE